MNETQLNAWWQGLSPAEKAAAYGEAHRPAQASAHLQAFEDGLRAMRHPLETILEAAGMYAAHSELLLNAPYDAAPGFRTNDPALPRTSCRGSNRNAAHMTEA